jgi:hypothetical protein
MADLRMASPMAPRGLLLLLALLGACEGKGTGGGIGRSGD